MIIELDDILYNIWEKLNQFKNMEDEIYTIYEIFQMVTNNEIKNLNELDNLFKTKRYYK